jgi:hypothetical protein
MSSGFLQTVTKAFTYSIIGQLFKGKGPDDQIQRIGDIANQTANEGTPRPIIYGRVRPIGGNIIAVQTPIVKLVKQKSQSSGGKGGSKKQPKTFVERVFRSYAIRICEGPITGVIRVWRNNKLVYDARGNAWGATNNGVFLQGARFYLGGWDQLPDPTLQSIFGADNVPAHRGTCYMVIINEDLTDLGGSVPQYVFEAERAEGISVTSKPYAIEAIDEAEHKSGSVKQSPSAQLIEALDSSGAVVSGVFRAPLLAYNAGFESLDSIGGSVVSGVFGGTITKAYNVGTESLDNTGGSVVSGVFRAALITYSRYPIESLNSTGGAVVGGSHGN